MDNESVNQGFLQKVKAFVQRHSRAAIAVLVLLLMIPILIFMFRRPSQPRRGEEPKISPSPVKTSSAPVNPIRDLTTEELRYQEAAPQSFLYESTASGAGQLVVTSSPDNAKVIIDGSEHGDEGLTVDLPIQTTPFKILRIPEGKHSLFISKPGYEFREVSFVIKSNEVTRLDLALDEL